MEAIQRFTVEKNVTLFGTHKVFNAEECAARQEVLLGHYLGTVETEALTMLVRRRYCATSNVP